MVIHDVKRHTNQSAVVFEKELLQRLLDSFSVATKMRVVFTDTSGNVLLSSTGTDCAFCSLVKSSPLGCERCRSSYARGGKQATKWNEPYFFRCHAGLVVWACPIISGGVHVGNFICGQVLMWEPEKFLEMEILEMTKDLMLDQGELIAALRELDIVSPVQVQAAADLLFVITNYLAQSGMGVLSYRRKLREVSSWLWAENHKTKRNEKGPDEDWDFLKLENCIVKEVWEGNIDGARELLEKLALNFFVKSKGQLDVLKGLSIEFVSFLTRLAVECGIKFEESMRLSMLNFKDLEKANSVEKVFLWMFAVGDSYLKLLMENQVNNGKSSLVKKAVAYIQKNYALPDLSLKQVARAVYSSPAYLSRLFKREMNCTLTEFINKVRVEQAKVALSDPSKSVAEVAHEVGYRDRSYFSRIFKEVTGMSPNEYRKREVVESLQV
ncbi:MAG: AraC-like transcriptional regulator [Thermoanaerobacterales bacterium 50_218]|nr:MAG: AraC-like transcriptional regulator [Thermoanaerobacterales bacterium 50_218]HAA90080.1 AraC family transcriptional regulator [Peptococcaceae bacterium]